MATKIEKMVMERCSDPELQALLEKKNLTIRVAKKKGIRTPYKLPLVLKKEQIDKFFSVINNSMYLCIFRLMSDCGLRISEVCDLKVQDVSLANRELKVVQGKGSKDRMVPIPASSELLNLLPVFLSSSDSHVFFHTNQHNGIIKPYKPRIIEAFCKKYALLAGLPKEVHPHTFRHIYASYLAESSVNLEAIRDNLGHATLASTNVYLHTQTENRKKLVDQVDFSHPDSLTESNTTEITLERKR